ncbi:hypothetical protein K466DRAFT_500188, partial [Polyporus arcularius HHB13444]
LVVYEYLLTLDREVRLVWGAGNRFSGASLLFLLSRYTALLRVMAFVVLWVTSVSHHRLYTVFFGLRVYAFTGHKIWPALLVFITLTTPVVTNAVCCDTLQLVRIHSNAFLNAVLIALPLELLIITRISVIIGDFLVLAVTWYCTFSTWQASRAVGLKTPLSALLLRDGEWHILVMY